MNLPPQQEKKAPAVPRLVGESQAIRVLRREIDLVSRSDVSVLLVGESGTGKDVVAQNIHAQSRRSAGAFVPLACAAIPLSLIEAELFGHERGSFTGATGQRRGVFESAAQGTLFLDEITESDVEMQAKLLRVLEDGSFHRVGGEESLRVSPRIISATNRDPQVAVANGGFRQDLYFRLAVVVLRVPALCERDDDAVLLAQDFLQQLNGRNGTRRRFSDAALRSIRGYSWPGNVRELRNRVQRAYILSDEVVHMDMEAPIAVRAVPSHADGVLSVPFGTPLGAVRDALLCATLEHFGGDKEATARALQISPRTIYNRLHEFRQRGHLPFDRRRA